MTAVADHTASTAPPSPPPPPPLEAAAPAGSSSTLADLNRLAVRRARAGDHAAAVDALTALLRRASEARVTRADLHVAYGNRSAAHHALGDHAAALADADACLALLRGARAGALPLATTVAKALLRRGRALAGLGRLRAAAAALEEGLALDPASAALSEALAGVSKRLREQQEGGGWDGEDGADGPLALEAAAPRALPITYAPATTPLALLRAPGDDDGDDGGGVGSGGSAGSKEAARWRARVPCAALPAALLSARRAAEDPNLGEVYEYARVQVCDLMGVAAGGGLVVVVAWWWMPWR